jgi:hypothetical protein
MTPRWGKKQSDGRDVDRTGNSALNILSPRKLSHTPVEEKETEVI